MNLLEPILRIISVFPLQVLPDMKVTMDLIANPSVHFQASRNKLSQNFISIASILDYINLEDIQQLLNIGKYHKLFFLFNTVFFV